MIVTLHSTTKLVELKATGGRVPVRIWEGKTSSGVPVQAYVTLISALATDDLTQFEAELKEQAPPSPEVAAIPLRLII